MATEASEILSQLNYRMIAPLDWMSPYQKVRKAQTILVTNPALITVNHLWRLRPFLVALL